MKLNNKTKTTIIILLLSLLLILSGCSSNKGGANVEPARKITGTDGLSIEIDGTKQIELFGEYPMTEVYKITIQNNGKYDIKDTEFFSKISLNDGLKSEQTDGKEILINSLSEFGESQMNYLEGQSQTRKTGDFMMKLLSVETNVPSGQGITSGFKVKSCYKYETIFSESICINSVKNARSKECEKDSYSFGSGQGAPIKISKVEVSDKLIDENTLAPRLKITIENAKKEIVTLPSNYQGGCLGQGDLNKIVLSEAKLGNSILQCNIKDNIIDLSKNINIIECNLDDNPNIESGDFFSTVLYLLLEYGYTSTEEFDIDLTRE